MLTLRVDEATGRVEGAFCATRRVGLALRPAVGPLQIVPVCMMVAGAVTLEAKVAAVWSSGTGWLALMKPEWARPPDHAGLRKIRHNHARLSTLRIGHAPIYTCSRFFGEI